MGLAFPSTTRFFSCSNSPKMAWQPTLCTFFLHDHIKEKKQKPLQESKENSKNTQFPPSICKPLKIPVFEKECILNSSNISKTGTNMSLILGLITGLTSKHQYKKRGGKSSIFGGSKRCKLMFCGGVSGIKLCQSALRNPLQHLLGENT
uniref:Uncharacterized protein n=1 Tax=Micrurus carvalhoi TaxID=3147026 RepID=A0A2H6MXY6_9SAUR